MNQLDQGYRVDVDHIDKNNWHNLLLEFDDAFILQTWSYGKIAWGE